MQQNRKSESASDSQAQQIQYGNLYMIVSVICFTITTLLLRYLGSGREISPSVALFFRAICGASIVLLFFRHRRPLAIKPIFSDRGLIWRGITGIVGTAAYYSTVPSLGAGKATLISNTYVLFAAIFAAILIGEKLKRVQFFWMSLAFLGIIFLATQGETSVKTATGFKGIHEMIAIIGALAAASTVVLIRRLTLRFSNGTIFMAQCLWLGMASLPFAIVKLPGLNPMDILFLSLAGFTAGFGQMLMNEGYRRMTVASGASIQIAWPLLTSIGGFIFFDERFSLFQLLGAGLILTGIWQVTMNKSTPSK